MAAGRGALPMCQGNALDVSDRTTLIHPRQNVGKTRQANRYYVREPILRTRIEMNCVGEKAYQYVWTQEYGG